MVLRDIRESIERACVGGGGLSVESASADLLEKNCTCCEAESRKQVLQARLGQHSLLEVIIWPLAVVSKEGEQIPRHVKLQLCSPTLVKVVVQDHLRQPEVQGAAHLYISMFSWLIWKHRHQLPPSSVRLT